AARRAVPDPRRPDVLQGDFRTDAGAPRKGVLGRDRLVVPVPGLDAEQAVQAVSRLGNGSPMEHAPKPEDRRDEEEEEAEGERHATAMQKFVGFVMLVLGWLQLLLAVSSGSEATSVPFLIYFAGVVIFVNGTVRAWYKYPLMLAATVAGLAVHYNIQSLGSATRWEKAVVVYGNIDVV